jgi:hypothetical protein
MNSFGCPIGFSARGIPPGMPYGASDGTVRVQINNPQLPPPMWNADTGRVEQVIGNTVIGQDGHNTIATPFVPGLAMVGGEMLYDPYGASLGNSPGTLANPARTLPFNGLPPYNGMPTHNGLPPFNGSPQFGRPVTVQTTIPHATGVPRTTVLPNTAALPRSRTGALIAVPNGTHGSDKLRSKVSQFRESHNMGQISDQTPVGKITDHRYVVIDRDGSEFVIGEIMKYARNSRSVIASATIYEGPNFYEGHSVTYNSDGIIVQLNDASGCVVEKHISIENARAGHSVNGVFEYSLSIEQVRGVDNIIRTVATVRYGDGSLDEFRID